MFSGSKVYACTNNLSYRKPLKRQKMAKAWSRETEKRKFRCKKFEEEMLGLEKRVWKKKEENKIDQKMKFENKYFKKILNILWKN